MVDLLNPKRNGEKKLTLDYLFGRAQSIVRKIERQDCTVAVFMNKNTVRSCTVDGELFQIAMNRALGQLVGVYNFRVQANWILDDLLYVAGDFYGAKI